MKTRDSNHHYAFDHAEQKWVPDDDDEESGRTGVGGDASVSMVQAGAWKTELTFEDRETGGASTPTAVRRPNAGKSSAPNSPFGAGVHVGKSVPLNARR